ncbi:MAG: 5'/3'-nucleotidase SurE [Bacteroidales bacterium]|nr:5'/3'-nucleotidase SurE [Bacteroidales bacterium]
MKPLILITNDDGVSSRGLHHLVEVAQEYGDIVVMAPDHNASGLSTSITTARPLRIREVSQGDGVAVYSCDGTPADCVKMGLEHFCPRKPDLVLSGINYGSNASINIIYSGTMGAALEACLNGCQSIGFSLLNHNPAADFEACTPTIRHILDYVMQHPLPDYTALNVNIPRLPAAQIKGIRVCRQARASWVDSLEKRIDPIGRPYWWMTGKFVCDNPPADSDEYLLAHGYATVVPIHPDFTAYHHLDNLKQIEL